MRKRGILITSIISLIALSAISSFLISGRLNASTVTPPTLPKTTKLAASPVKTSNYPWIHTAALEYGGNDAIEPYFSKNISHFDIHVAENSAAIKALKPESIVIVYRLWESQVVTDIDPYTNDRVKMQKWSDITGKDLEDFYLHYNQDVLTQGDKSIIKVIPGWDPANDGNSDGQRDLPSDWGTSVAVGTQYLDDSTKSWTTNEWAGATLVDKNGGTYTVASNAGSRLYLEPSENSTPASGRYGLSAAGSANHRATARTRKDARVMMYIWANQTYIMNVGSDDYRQFRIYDSQKMTTTDDTTWDPQASSKLDGFMIDTFTPTFRHPQILNGSANIVEYPNADDNINGTNYKNDMAGLLGTVKQALPNIKLMPNTGNYLFESASVAGGGALLENMVAPSIGHGPFIWNYWKKLSDQNTYVLAHMRDDAPSITSDRQKMHTLAYYYVGQQPYVYYTIGGFAPGGIANEAKWFNAMNVNIGTPVNSQYVTAENGTRKDPTGQNVYIYTRKYTNALVVSRPRADWNYYNYGNNTAVSYTLPSYTTSTGRQSNLYKPLLVNGTFGDPVTKISLRSIDGFILFPTEKAPVLKINNGASYTRKGTVTLNNITSADTAKVSSMRFSNNKSSWTPWLTYAASRSWNLTSGYGATTSQGIKKVYVQYKFASGKFSHTPYDSIIYDKTAPVGSIKINNGRSSTSLKYVTLYLKATDNYSGLKYMRFSNNGRKWSRWKTFAIKYRRWNLTSSTYGGTSRKGTKYVYVQYRDKAGNTSIRKYDRIRLR